MSRTKHILAISPLLIAPLVCLFMTSASLGYVDLAPTLAKIISESKTISLVEVVQIDRAKHQVVLKQIRALKGDALADPIQHDVASGDGGIIPRQILQWASPGNRGVMFGSRTTSLVCMGEGWYSVRTSGTGPWKLGAERPDLPLAYHGSLSRLAESVELMLAGKDAVLTVVAFGADNEGASFDLALNRQNLPGLARVQRIRANLTMPQMVAAASSNPAYFIGVGPVDEADIPQLIEKLKSSDTMVRAESADDLRSLNHKARSAVPALTQLLIDPSSHVRFSAAAALLRIEPKETEPLVTLTKGLDSTDPAIRNEAAKATGLSGTAAGPLTKKLAALLKDSDESMRITSLQAISLLGRAASDAVEAVIPLLDNPELSLDAVDALGRIGPAARPALKRIAPMLSSEHPAVQWAAVRAMSQIGGEEAHPAVEYMIKALPKATEVEGYNMMIYLSLLGPVASDALPTIWNTPIKNPVLPSATQWAIAPDKSFPWLGGGGGGGGRGGRGGRGGPGGGPGGGGGGDIFTYVYQAYVRELGDRLRPAAKVLAQKIMDGTAGEIPSWGYEILACGPEDVVAVLTPHLADDDINMRERAAVALSHLGPSGAPAKEQLAAAVSRAPTEREQRLLKWCLREIEPG